MSRIILKRVQAGLSEIESIDKLAICDQTPQRFLSILLRTQFDRGNTTFQVNDDFSIEGWTMMSDGQFDREKLPSVPRDTQHSFWKQACDNFPSLGEGFDVLIDDDEDGSKLVLVLRTEQLDTCWWFYPSDESFVFVQSTVQVGSERKSANEMTSI